MAVATRCNPKDFFTPDEWAKLSAQSNWKGLALVAHCWAVIIGAAAMALIWPITIPLAIVIIGGRQLGLGILNHDAAHGALHKNAQVNDWVGKKLLGGGLDTYRKTHLQHHKFAQQREDPDLKLSAPFPITPTSLARKIRRDLTGQTYFQARFGGTVKRLSARKPGEKLAPLVWAELVRHRSQITQAVLFTAIGAPFGYWWAWWVLWLLPSMTWRQMITRFRSIAEHSLVAVDEPDPLKHARTTKANLVERALVAPYYVNYHCEHHMFMHIPCYQLPRAHRLLKAKGYHLRMEIQPDYLTMLRRAASKPEKRPPVAVAA